MKECVEPEEGRTEEEERNVKQKYNGREKKDILREKQKLSSEQREVSKNQFTGLHKFMCHKSVTNCWDCTEMWQHYIKVSSCTYGRCWLIMLQKVEDLFKFQSLEFN